MRLFRHKWLLGLGLALIIGVVVGFTYNRAPQSQYFTAKAQRGNIHDVVQATGTINAVITVQVGSQVSGTISRLFADFNSRVKQGEVVAQIEPSLFEGALLQAKADQQNARANLAAAQAELEKAKATAAQTRADYKRTEGLAREGVMSPQQLDLARANADTAAAGVTAAEATVKQAAAQVNLKAAAVDVAQTNLNHTIIHAPINGIVVARNVDVGQTVAASLQAPTLFNIAQDLTKMQVDTQTDESDVGNIKVGQETTFTVDAYPNQTFRGKVVQIR
ncbi:MAG TPA: efflux RND transporter periplasmic adaptor subunit, partial [Terriglobales bacterium]|nr:efflux RND transporter periplasmic adaptor subunit [Terriglobales bacterium]